VGATKHVLAGNTEFDVLPEFTTYGNMGIDYGNHLRIVDYTPFDIFKKDARGSHAAPRLDLENFGYEFLMFCLNYEHFFASRDDQERDAGEMVLSDPLYRKYLFDKYQVNVTPERVGSLLQEWNGRCLGAYVNLPGVLTK
jgi:hypothetical protein